MVFAQKILRNLTVQEKLWYATGCCFGIQGLDFSKIGMFNEEFSMYGEDVDFSLNAKRNGGSIYLEISNSMIWHMFLRH